MGNRNAGREAARSASRQAIAPPAALAARLGRDLSASAVDDGGWTDLHYVAAFGWPAAARALLIDGAPVDARLKADAEPLGPRVLDTLRRYGRDGFRRRRGRRRSSMRCRPTARRRSAFAVRRHARSVASALLARGADSAAADAAGAAVFPETGSATVH